MIRSVIYDMKRAAGTDALSADQDTGGYMPAPPEWPPSIPLIIDSKGGDGQPENSVPRPAQSLRAAVASEIRRRFEAFLFQPLDDSDGPKHGAQAPSVVADVNCSMVPRAAGIRLS